MNCLNECFFVSQDMGHDFRKDCFDLFTVIKWIYDCKRQQWCDNKKIIKHLEVTYRPSLWPRQVGVSLLGFWERALNRALSNRRFACSWRGLRVTSVVEIRGLYKTKKEFYTLLSKCWYVSRVIQNLQKVYNLWFPCTCAILNIRMSK